jgi:hypothetical protein
MLKSKVLVMLVIASTALVAACEDEGPDDEEYTATLNGASEVPANNSTATGSARFVVNANRTISYNLTVSGLTPTQQHIHGPITTPTGTASPIVDLAIGTNLTLTETSFNRGVSYDSALVLLRNNRTYVNVHTAAIPAGEIRGNLIRQ